jgi:hypothetical protein
MEINITISDRTLAYTLVTVFEMHIGGWIKGGTPELVGEDRAQLTEECRKLIEDDGLDPFYVCPLIPGAGKIELAVYEGKTYSFGAEEIEKGLALMAEKYGRHFRDLVSENGDAWTADLLLQLTIFGKEVYA